MTDSSSEPGNPSQPAAEALPCALFSSLFSIHTISFQFTAIFQNVLKEGASRGLLRWLLLRVLMLLLAVLLTMSAGVVVLRV
jgi:hypothetical protein